ncbi:MAG: hypothetical protein IJ272_05560 [Clostridia bacterium]|nr:hypothetical protein [Clostridia bacterium]
MNTTCVPKMKLTTANVEQILKKCLYVSVPTEDEIDNPIEVEGFQNMFTFNPAMLEEEKHNIEDMLTQLPEQFKEGWSFWELYRTQDGHQWTSTARIMEALMVLGIAVEKISYVLPKSSWWSLPGGAPYVVLNA